VQFCCICISIFATNQLKLHFILLDQQLRTCQHSARCCIKLLSHGCHSPLPCSMSSNCFSAVVILLCRPHYLLSLLNVNASFSTLASSQHVRSLISNLAGLSFSDINYLLQIYLLSWISNVCYKFIYFPEHQMACHKFIYGKISSMSYPRQA
jgi:hypothetical protein